MFKTKKQDKTQKKSLMIKISEVPDKEFKIIIIKMLTKLRRVDKHSESYNNEIENTKQQQTGPITEDHHKCTEKYIRGTRQQTRQSGKISEVENRAVELTQLKQQKEKDFF